MRKTRWKKRENAYLRVCVYIYMFLVWDRASTNIHRDYIKYVQPMLIYLQNYVFKSRYYKSLMFINTPTKV